MFVSIFRVRYFGISRQRRWQFRESKNEKRYSGNYGMRFFILSDRLFVFACTQLLVLQNFFNISQFNQFYSFLTNFIIVINPKVSFSIDIIESPIDVLMKILVFSYMILLLCYNYPIWVVLSGIIYFSLVLYEESTNNRC